MRAAAKEWLIRISFLVVSSLVALLMAEGLVRVFFPIYEWFEPGSVYRQVSNEYDARTTITRQGHRVPGTDRNPDVVFLGDSFTYGYGLNDDQTFAAIYCSRRRIECANLGMPGSGTSKQVQRLEQFIEKWNWRPREVKLFFFGMSSSFSAGNDFVDNYDYGRWLNAKSAGRPIVAGPRPTRSVGERMISWQARVLEHSTLMRRVKYHWGPLLKSMILADPGDRMDEALLYTQRGLQDLDDLSRRVGFEYSVYLVVPVHDIIRGSYPDTLAALNRVSRKPAIATAPLFVDAPQSFYYAYDGHLNPAGSQRVAEFLISLDSPKVSN
jgi:hypothetical protein